MQLLYFFLPIILFLGIITSIEDIKIGKIRNKWTILGFGFGILMNLGIFLYLTLSQTVFRTDYYVEYLINLGSMMFIAYIIWWVGLWTAGDAKLMIAFTALIPLSVFKLGYVENFPIFTLLLNIFIPMFFVLGTYVIVKSKWSDKKLVFKEMMNPKMLLIFAIAVFALMWVVNFLFFAFPGIPQNYFSMVFFLFIFLTVVEKILPLSFTKFIYLLAIARFIFDRTIFNIDFLMNYLGIFLTMLILRFFLIRLSTFVFSKNVKFDQLKKKMILAQVPIIEKDKIEMMPFSQIDFLGYLTNKVQKKPLISYDFAEGLSEKAINELKTFYRNRRILFNTIRVYTTVPFAPFVFLGVIITLISQGGLVEFVKLLIVAL